MKEIPLTPLGGISEEENEGMRETGERSIALSTDKKNLIEYASILITTNVITAIT